MLSAVITGATGTVGRQLVGALGSVHALGRDADRVRHVLGSAATAFAWDTTTKAPPKAFEQRDAVFHLAGEPIGTGRWTATRKQRIYDSRVLGTRALVDTLITLPRPPRVLVTASAVGIYGDRGDNVLTEASPPGDDFLASVCTAWEHEAARAESAGIRVVCARLGIVLARQGGALAPMVPLFRLGIGGPLGDGSQWMPWVHIDDVIGLLLHAAESPDIRGPLNVVAPQAVTNQEFSRTLGKVLRRPAWLSAPRFAVRIAFGEVADAVFASWRVDPQVARATGYRYRFADLEAALRACV